MECPCDCQGYLDERCRSSRGMCGRENAEVCPYCGGEGSNEIHRPQHDDPGYCEVVKCTECNGSGYVTARHTSPLRTEP